MADEQVTITRSKTVVIGGHGQVDTQLDITSKDNQTHTPETGQAGSIQS